MSPRPKMDEYMQLRPFHLCAVTWNIKRGVQGGDVRYFPRLVRLSAIHSLDVLQHQQQVLISEYLNVSL